MPRDERLLRTLRTLGRQIGEFAVRSGARAEVTGLNNRLHGFLDASTQVAIIATDLRGTITTFNTGAERMLGYAREEMIGFHSPALIHIPAEVEEYADTLFKDYGIQVSGFPVFVERARRGDHDEREWTYVRKDGTRLTVLLTVTAIRDFRGEIVGFLGIAKDVTRSHNAERQLRKFAALVEHSGDFIAMANLEGEVTYINPAGRELVGIKDHLVHGPLRISDVLDDSDQPTEDLKAIPTARRTGRWTGEAHLRRFSDGATLEIEANLFMVSGVAPDQPIGLGAIIRDITARKRDQALLLDRKARLRGIMESSLDALITIDHQGQIIEFNPSAERIFGCTRAEAMEHQLATLIIPPEYREAHLAGLRRYSNADGGVAASPSKNSVIGRRIEIDALRADGTRFPVELAISLVRTSGPPVFTASLRDISDRKRAEARLQESERRFRDSFDCAPIGMALVSLQGRWLLVNRALCEIVGYDEAELLKRDFQGITHPDDLDADLEQVQALLGNQFRSYQIEKRYIHRRGHAVWVILAVSLVRDAEGSPLYFISQIEDITLKRQAMESLRIAKEQAEAANQAKASFLANMSHEVRTPMAAVLGYADMLTDPQLNPGDREHALQAIRRNGTHLMQVIDDILDLSKIEAGRMDLDLIVANPWQITQEVLSSLQIRAHERHVEIQLQATTSLPPRCVLDPTRVRQILLNLISNAIKFTEQGGQVQVRVAANPGGPEDEIRLRFEVEDTGIGMTPDQLAQLFIPFQQADATTTRRFGGSGLGLSICHRLTEAMKGRITVRSQPNQGSLFAVEIPVAIPVQEAVGWVDPADLGRELHETTDQDDAATQNLFSARVLLVEDSEAIRRILTYSLRRMGLVVETAENGRIGVQRALSLPYDLILMDMQMPQLDGYSAASWIRRSGLRTPIVALTAHALAEDREHCLRAGCNDYLTKPVATSVLAATLRKYLRVDLESASPPEPDSLSILIREFTTGLPVKLARIQSLHASGNLAGLASLTHQLRGVAGMYGFPSLSEVAGLVEDAISEGQEADLIQELVEDLVQAILQIPLDTA